MVASLSVPWGEASNSRGGYHLVWARDLVESAGALVALGCLADAQRILSYLMATQQGDGHWLQNQWLGGKPFWQGIQLDETAFPVLLASMLADRDALESLAVADMVHRALRFLAREGPVTCQDRWEEDTGINTFTVAVAIAALVEGSRFLEAREAECALMLADAWNARLEDWAWVTDTALSRQLGVAGYYMRTAPPDVLTHDGAKHEALLLKNRAQSLEPAADEQLAIDCLQLARFGLRTADDPQMAASVRAIDALLRTDTPRGPVWHRYNGDGYGEHPDGAAFDGWGVGRGWPLLTGERGHFALLNGDDARPYLEAMTRMTGIGGLLPEQVWDSAPIAERGLYPGRPSGSAMPLVWAHAEFIKLATSLAASAPVDRPTRTWARYRGRRPQLDYALWQPRQRVRSLVAGQELRILLPEPAQVHWGINGWNHRQDVTTEDWGLGYVVRLPTSSLAAGEFVNFTFYWPSRAQWQGEDFRVDVT
jgi:glucoamylase